MVSDKSVYKNIDDDVRERIGILGVCGVYNEGCKISYAPCVGDVVALYSRLMNGNEEDPYIRVKILGFAEGRVFGEIVENCNNQIPLGTKVSFSENRMFPAMHSQG